MRTSSVLFAIAPAVASLFLFACSGDDSSNGGTTADAGATTDGSTAKDAQASDSSPGVDSGTSDTGTSDTGTTTDSGGGDGGDGGVSLDCASYCSEIQTNCTGAQQQFTDMASCMGFCQGYPKGALGDMSGDTLGCRIYHAGAPAKSNAVLHCPHAGPTGGDKGPDGGAGVCGEPCDAFCQTAAVVCTGANQQFADMNACMTACQGFKPDTAAYSTADTATNDLGCRVYHLSAASSSASNATLHCPHIVAASAVCTM